ncbi:MAG TPA: hypothetical protein VFD13_02190 [Candidatus Kapabacteria bacterium]|nr:hypothetical protein [Candidatus Kapabacteria bacterium]
MTHDERISSYIDNELSAEQEQEFLISLAASDGLRKSFRSELVLKKVLHHDEAATNPPRNLRAAIFTTLGLGLGASALSASKAHAASSTSARMIGHAPRGLVKTLFATKMSALVTVAGISASALAGYGVRSIITPTPMVSPRIEHVVNVAPVDDRSSAATQPVVTSPAIVPAGTVSNIPPTNHRHFASGHSQHSNAVAPKQETIDGTAGGGTVQMGKTMINGKQ